MTAVQKVLLLPGGVAQVGERLEACGARRPLFVTGASSFQTCGAAAALAPLLRAEGVARFSEFAQNPQLEDACRGLALFRSRPFDALVAVGGGTAIDMAKLIACFAAQSRQPEDCLREDARLLPRQVPLIVAPTTAGTGSEATHFAVVYHAGRKHSVAHESLLPDAALIDPLLTLPLPPRLTAITGLDALCQAVESFWSVNATPASQSDARDAIVLVLESLKTCVLKPTLQSRTAMSWAAYLAGRAINVSKTTAAHALSYTMTSQFGVPHGHAVALTLAEMLVHNAGVDEETVTDPRGTDYVQKTMGELYALFGCQTAMQTYQRLKDFMREIGVETHLSDVGILGDRHRRTIAEAVNLERLANNPRALTPEDLQQVLKRAA